MEIQQPEKKSSTSCTTVALIVGILLLSVIGFFGYKMYDAVQSMKGMSRMLAPGQGEFEAAEKLIARYDGQAAFGNTEESKIMAATFSEQMEALRKEMFSEGKKGTFSLTDGKFLTYCNLLDGKCVFIVHAPQLRKFTKDSQKSLTELSWYCANAILKNANYPENTELAVGVKGMVSYGGIYTGQLDREDAPLSGVKLKTEGFDERKVLQHFFNNARPPKPLKDSKNIRASGKKEPDAGIPVDSATENTPNAKVNK